jgi:NAD(P)-dependent dehydrogenase (short-subunit alcohol dehydrogenase family)
MNHLEPDRRGSALPLDVTRPESIAAALEAGGPIDVLVNPASIGVVGVFEVAPMAALVAVSIASVIRP